jgi:hypothetical protein
MWEGYWNFTTCINNQNLTLIESEIITLLKKQGGVPINNLPPLIIPLEELQAKHPTEQSSHIWIVGLYPGNNGWTVIKTYPSELLCHSVNYDYDCYSQLSMLTMQLNSNAFHLSVYGDDWGFLVEADDKGKNLISGCFHLNIPSNEFYLQLIKVPGLIKQFSLLNIPENIQTAISVHQSPDLKLQIANIKKKFDPFWEQDLTIGYTELIDEALKLVMDNSNQWYIYNLAYCVYTQFKSLAEHGMRLLYFQPPLNYKNYHPYNLDSADELELFGIVSKSMLNEDFDGFGLVD